MAGGEIVLPDGPGLGYTVREDKVDRYAVARWRFGPGV